MIDFGRFVAFWEHQNYPCSKFIEIFIVLVYYNIPLVFGLLWYALEHHFKLFYYFVSLWITNEGSVPEMHIYMIYIVYWIWFKIGFTFEKNSHFIFQLLGECHCWWSSEFSRAHVAKFYDRLWSIRSVLRASKLSVFKIHLNCYLVGVLHNPVSLQLVLVLLEHYFKLFYYFVLLLVTYEGSVPEKHRWSLLLIKSDLKRCIHLRRSLFLYTNVNETTDCQKYTCM